jgi:hypothetical protein
VEGGVGSVVVLLEVDTVGVMDAQLQSHPSKIKRSSQLLVVGSERSFRACLRASRHLYWCHL